jgi:hypothetical protein
MKQFNKYLLPVPTRYVFVPCSVIRLGLHPKIRMTRDERRAISGKTADMMMMMGKNGTRMRRLFRCRRQHTKQDNVNRTTSSSRGTNPHVVGERSNLSFPFPCLEAKVSSLMSVLTQCCSAFCSKLFIHSSWITCSSRSQQQAVT